MKYEWDERKNEGNIHKHGFDFKDASEIFTAPILIAFDDRKDYGEDRWIAIGLLRGRVVVLVFVERGERVRFISLRKALSYERKKYEENFTNRLG